MTPTIMVYKTLNSLTHFEQHGVLLASKLNIPFLKGCSFKTNYNHIK